MPPRRVVLVLACAASLFSVGACNRAGSHPPAAKRPGPSTSTTQPQLGQPAPPAPLGDRNIYASAGVNMLSPVAAEALPRIYVPNSDGHSLDVIDPATKKVVDRMTVGKNPQHVVPAWDLKTLYVTNDLANSLTPIDPKTATRAGPDIAVDDPYNMYFTPDGTSAIVVAEARRHLDFRDPHTFALRNRVTVGCRGVDHMDFAADKSYLIATCEFSGELLKLDLRDERIVGYLDIGGKPQDIKVDPAGKVFYVADMNNGGVHEIDGDSFTKIGFLPTGPEAHGLYPSRDAKVLYVSESGRAERSWERQWSSTLRRAR